MILGISGHKQSGKNTTANILHGIVLKEMGFINDWNIDALGHLNILNEGGWGYFDVTRKDEQFVTWADNNMWPFVKLYSFADNLKAVCTELFNIPFRCLYGTDEEKNQLQEHLLWENMPGITTTEIFSHGYLDAGCGAFGVTHHKPGPMTAREFMQHFGSDVCRHIYEPIWVQSCLNKIKKEESELAIIADVRFPNEVKAIEDAGGTVLRLTRNIYKDNHASEVALDNHPFTNVINNSNESIDSLMVKVKKFYSNLKERHASNLC